MSYLSTYSSTYLLQEAGTACTQPTPTRQHLNRGIESISSPSSLNAMHMLYSPSSPARLAQLTQTLPFKPP